jgi:Uncharacterized conserved protein
MTGYLSKIMPLLLITLACDPEPVLIDESQVIADAGHTGVYVLSEGLFNQNNSTLSWIDFSSGQPDSWNSAAGRSFDVFEKVNGRRSGDTANDLLLYGSRLYIAVSESGTIEILDASTCRSLRQITLNRNGNSSQPRRMTASGGFVYVCCFDGTVTRIDTLTMMADATVRVGRNPDGICCAAGKLYVSNSGGLDPQHPDNTVSVIDLNTFTETRRITVRSNPGNIYTDGTGVYVVSRGIFDYGTMDYDSRLHRIDTQTDEVTATFDIPILNMDIADGQAWFYGYGAGGTIQVLDLNTGKVTDSDFITDGTRVMCPYSIKVEPATHKVYVCDALDYVTPGSLLCFSPDGRLLYRVQGIGINPNTVAFWDGSVTLTQYQGEPEIIGHIDRVFEYMPAPGQFVNLLPRYEPGDNARTMADKCLKALQSGNMITLGAFGGYITAGFNTPVSNGDGPDFRIDGNAYKGNAEPGVVWVSTDFNANGLPDDPWYEIWGSEQREGRSTPGYTATYSRPATDNGDSPWIGSDGRTGSVMHNQFHSQPYFPQWYDSESVSFTATLLPDNITYTDGIYVMSAFGYGYVDNRPNSAENSAFDIDWAVKPDGTPAGLSSIDFIKIQNGMTGCNGTTGEQSTEVSAIYNLNIGTE